MSPRQITRITPKDVGRFSIDDENNLYWDGQLIHTSAVVRLSRFQSGIVILAGLATISSSIAAWTTYLTVARPQWIAAQRQSVSPSPAPPVSLPQTPPAQQSPGPAAGAPPPKTH
jgi:hypothetical protein